MPAKPEVMVCVNRRFGGTKPSCAERGSLALASAIEAALRAVGSPVPVTRSVCQNACEQGPAVRVLPGPVLFRAVSADDVAQIVATAIVAGGGAGAVPDPADQ